MRKQNQAVHEKATKITKTEDEKVDNRPIVLPGNVSSSGSAPIKTLGFLGTVGALAVSVLASYQYTIAVIWVFLTTVLLMAFEYGKHLFNQPRFSATKQKRVIFLLVSFFLLIGSVAIATALHSRVQSHKALGAVAVSTPQATASPLADKPKSEPKEKTPDTATAKKPNKKEPSQAAASPAPHDPSVIIKDSPNAIGINAGRDINAPITINQGSQPRKITEEKRTQMLEILRSAPKGTIIVNFALSNGEAHTLAKQIVEVLTTAGWNATLGSPTIEGTVQSGLCIFVHGANTPAAGALQKALGKVGLPTDGIENPKLPELYISLFVGPKPD